MVGPEQFHTISDADMRRQIGVARATTNAITAQLVDGAQDRLVTPADRQRAADIGRLLGGNGLSHDQQLELVALHIALHRLSDMRRGRGDWGMNAILQADHDIAGLERVIAERMRPRT